MQDSSELNEAQLALLYAGEKISSWNLFDSILTPERYAYIYNTYIHILDNYNLPTDISGAPRKKMPPPKKAE